MSLARWSLEGPAAATRRTMRDARPGLCAGGRVAVNEGRACYPSDGQQSNRTGGRGVTNIWMRSCSADRDGMIRTDRARHPFYVDGEGATAEFFLARDRRTGEAVGRVAAILCERYNRHRRDSGAAPPLQGFFGFFDSIDSLDVTEALLESAARWLRE